MAKIFTLDDFIDYSKNQKHKKDVILKPSKRVIKNILNFSKSYYVAKASKNKSFEMILN